MSTGSSSSSGGDYGGDSDGGSNSSLAGAGGRTNVAAVLDGAVQAAEESDAGVPNSANAAAAVAVQPAAHVKQQQLPLHAFRAANITSPALLQHLPGQLRSLSITLSRSCTAEQAQQIASSLSRLTGLTQLCMNIRDEQFLVAAALTSFRQLQVLELKNVSSPAALQHLPQQLKQLHFIRELDSTTWAMQLQHLTALTALDCSCTAQWPVADGDALPAGLALLRAAVLDLEPVLALRHLQRLEIIVNSQAVASQLGQLTALQALTALHLETSEMAAVGAALPQLPVKHLKVTWEISTTAVQQLGQLQGLTSLVLLGKWFPHYQQLAESLQQLTALQQLFLSAGVNGAALLDSAGLSLQFVAALPELQSCRVLDTPLDPASITALQAATGLTYLEIDVCRMAQDWAVAAVVQKLTLLQHLSLGPRWTKRRTKKVTSAVLPAIAQLTHLTYLNLSGTAVNLSSVTCLTALHQLKELYLAKLSGCPSCNCPSGGCPSCNCPSEDCPSGGCPSGGCPSGGCPSHWSTAVNMAVVMQLTSLSHLTSLWLPSSAFDARAFPGSSVMFESMLRESLPYCEMLVMWYDLKRAYRVSTGT